MDDAHACIDTIKDQVSIKLFKQIGAYGEIISLFDNALKAQGEGTYADLKRGEYDAILPVPYWAWIDKSAEVAGILSRHKEKTAIKFAWPLLKDMLQDCQCVISGTALEISPHLPPLYQFESFSKAQHRVFMSATVTDDSFLVRGLRLPQAVITSPLVYAKEKWSGEKMILIPSLIDASLDRSTIVERLTKGANKPRNIGMVALCPSVKSTSDWKAYGADIADRESIETSITDLKNSNFSKMLVIVNRYDGIDLPDKSCRILIMDSRPYSESVLDRYMEHCLGSGEAIAVKTARKIEQGLGRSVRGERDYCVIILTGPDLIKQIRTTSSRRLFSTQTKTQIEIGLEIAKDAKAEGEPLASFNKLIRQCLSRDQGWKEFYVDKMNSISSKANGHHRERLDIFSLELLAEEKAEYGVFDEAANVLQGLIDKHIKEEAEHGWYLQEMARLIYRSSKTKSNAYQVAAHKKNRYLLKPREGMVFQNVKPLSQKRVDLVINKVQQSSPYEDLALTVEEIVSKLVFGVESDTFEKALDALGKLLGFACERPDAEWKEGPDNLWCLRDGDYLLIESKSMVFETRAEIYKEETDQMNRSVNWFMKNYPKCKARHLLIHPAKKLHNAAAFMCEVEVVRKAGLQKLTTNVRNFFGEFKAIDVGNLSPDFVQTLLDTHGLGLKDLWKK